MSVKFSKGQSGLYLLIALMVCLFSEIHFYPLDGGLRLSLGIVILYSAYFMRDELKLTTLTFLSGGLILIERTLVRVIWMNQSWEQVASFLWPAAMYYLAFGLFFSVIDLRRYKNNFIISLGIMAGVDCISNIIEALFRHGLSYQNLQLFMIVGLLRAVSAYGIYQLWLRQSLFIQKQEHQKRYIELTQIASNLESELFYLEKSSEQIESLMQESFSLYNELQKASPHKEKALEIARGVHEIKKDYIRVISGFRDLDRKIENLEALQLQEILSVVKASAEKVMRCKGNQVKLNIQCHADFVVKDYLKYFTILNNLIDNSLYAIPKNGWIEVEAEFVGQNLIFLVRDNGMGIEPECLEVIFNPGFTTKYDPITGKANTGIGLSHVKNIVENLGGTISVHSQVHVGTQVRVSLPIQSERSGTYEANPCH